MSAAATASAVELVPRRTWRQWWLTWPKWFRIGAWGLVVLLLLHFAVAIRIVLGLVETREVAEFRRHHSRGHPWTVPGIGYRDGLGPRPEWFRGHRLLLTGLYGRSNANVVAIVKDVANESDLKYIGKHFPNLESLELFHADVTPDGLAALHSCRNLKQLIIESSDLDESAVQQIPCLENLEELRISCGLVSRHINMLLPKLPRLRQADISDFGQAAMRDGEGLSFAELELTIRWSDGERSANLNRWYQLVVEVPEPADDIRIRPFDASSRLEAMRFPIKSNFKDCGDGDYRFHLRVGDQFAEPVTIKVENGGANTGSLEFQMPCTKAEAMK